MYTLIKKNRNKTEINTTQNKTEESRRELNSNQIHPKSSLPHLLYAYTLSNETEQNIK